MPGGGAPPTVQAPLSAWPEGESWAPGLTGASFLTHARGHLPGGPRGGGRGRLRHVPATLGTPTPASPPAAEPPGGLQTQRGSRVEGRPGYPALWAGPVLPSVTLRDRDLGRFHWMILAQVSSCSCSPMSRRAESLAALPDTLELTFPWGLVLWLLVGCLNSWPPGLPPPPSSPTGLLVHPHDIDWLPPGQRQPWRSPCHFCNTELAAHGSPAL